ncbi:MAG TPA: class I SAM-dependent methyltransferase [Azospirillaceae bacterium]|nr:class I SAM-dependent methyltransferase [Azospirillaceae bacterium]
MTGTPPACPLCGGTAYDAVGQVPLGRWERDGDALARREAWLSLGRCTVCGHVRMLDDYTPALLDAIYGRDPFVSTAEFANAGAGTVDFCRPELAAARGRVVDVGCGGGALLAHLRDGEGIAAARLLGIDFLPKLPPGIPFLERDLNRLDGVAAAEVGGPFSFAFCTHVLEHVIDPRAFLRALRGWLEPGGHLLVEVPDFSRADPAGLHRVALVCPQHIHYFTPESLRRLCEACGFDPVRSDGGTRLLLRAAGVGPAADTVRLHLDTLAARRAGIAAQVLALPAAGVWGVGAEFARMREEVPGFDHAVRAGEVALFDLLNAGLRVDGVPIHHPDAIAGFGGRVAILPANAIVRGKMREAARSRGWYPGTVFDPWDD